MTRPEPGQAEEFCLWISHPAKTVSFHPERGFQKFVYPDRSAMWESVRALLEESYLIL